MAARHVVRIVVRASVLVGAPFACAAPARAQPASRVTWERALSPALRELRADGVRPTGVAGQVVLGARRVAAGAAIQDLVATDPGGRDVPLQRLGGALLALQPAPDQREVVRPTRVAEQPMARGLQWLPGVCLMPPAGPGNAPDVLSGYADFSTVPVVWDTEIDAYRVSGHIGVARNGDPSFGGATARTSDGAIVGSVVVHQAAPWPQVLAALLGGAIGGYARRLVGGARRQWAARRVIEGTIVGLRAFVAGVLSVSYLALPDMIVATVAGAFPGAALAGCAGVVVLERMQPERRSGREGGR